MGFNSTFKGLMRQSFILQQSTVAVDRFCYSSVTLGRTLGAHVEIGHKIF